MNYFLLHSDPRYVDSPEFLDWSGKIDPRNIRPGASHKIARRQILNIRPNPHIVFVDVISAPFLLLSKKCMEVVTLYEPQVISKQIILLDMETPQRETYYLPILKQIHCLAEGSEWNLDKSVLSKGVINLEPVGDTSIFQLADMKNIYTVIRVDVLESMLKRGARGVGITPLETVKGAKCDG